MQPFSEMSTGAPSQYWPIAPDVTLNSIVTVLDVGGLR
jgi:hypothetical protein